MRDQLAGGEFLAFGRAAEPGDFRHFFRIIKQLHANGKSAQLQQFAELAGQFRDGLGIIKEAKEAGVLAAQADPAQRVVLVPAFAGLGAPHWDAKAQAAIYGLTRNSGPAELARAALESVGYQTRDLLEAMRADWGTNAEGILRVDGGMTASDWAMQFLSDILGAPVDRPVVTETTALGAAYLAGLQAGLCAPPEDFQSAWALERRFTPAIDPAIRDAKYARWGRAVAATMSV